MTEQEIEQLKHQNMELAEKVRVQDERIRQQEARIQDLLARDTAIEKQKDRWFGYKQESDTVRGAFDMLMVSSWQARLAARKGWFATVHVGGVSHALDVENTKRFFDQFDRYIGGKL
jgi:hypothetical protein